MSFEDHFSGHAAEYAASRPSYPEALFEYLAGIAPARDLAWDCATGSGQAALALAPHFRRVVATDASPEQVAQARPRDRVEYGVAPAERSPLGDASVDLVTVAQALHWFDRPAFYAEVRRVARPGGILAAWCYQLHAVDPAVDAAFLRLYAEVVGPYWPAGRRLVEEGYRTLAFPFEEITPPAFDMTRRWDLGRLLNYVRTWSAVQRFAKERGSDPIALVEPELVDAWGDPSREREVRWPLHLRIGIISPRP